MMKRKKSILYWFSKTHTRKKKFNFLYSMKTKTRKSYTILTSN